jgi:tetratricopeptide (TPR) repeat protein
MSRRAKVCALLAPAVALATGGPALAAQCKIGVMANLPVTMDGLRASVPVKINGRDTDFWLDSGAFFSIMPRAKAVELDLPLQPAPEGFYLVGVGGSAAAQLTTVKSFGIVGQEIRNVQFLVGGSDIGNGVLGRNLLGLADTEFDLASGSVKLIRHEGCDKTVMTYWAPGKPYFTVPLLRGLNPRDHVFNLPVSINGARIDAAMDSGAPTTLISRRAAEKAGIDLSGPGVVPMPGIGGIGRRVQGGWIVPVETVSVGDEQILKTHLAVIDGDIAAGEGAPDMLLGADFMLAHHIYVARSQGRIYFTYNGGRPFQSRTPELAATAAPSSTPVALPPGTRRAEAVAASAEPRTAEEFARRGNARLSQRAFAGGIADLSEAIRLAPNTAAYYRDRSRAYFQNHQPELARADLHKALEIDPANDELLRVRAYMRLAEHDRAGALADAEAAARVTPPSSLDAAEVANLFERLGQPARAIAIYDAVIDAHREDSRLGTLLNGRCWVRALANVELDKALDDCNRAIRRDGDKAAYLDSRGLARFRRRDFAAALADYDAALKLAPQQAWSLYMRGMTKIALGQADAGKADQTAAAAISPDIAEEVASFGLHR